jgi:hypothetical protein
LISAYSSGRPLWLASRTRRRLGRWRAAGSADGRDGVDTQLGVAGRGLEGGVDEQAADVDGGALARAGDLKPPLDRLRALDERLDGGKLAVCKLAQPFPGRVAVLRVGEVANLVEGESGALGDVDDREPVKNLLGVAPLSRVARRFGQDAELLVVANARRAHPGAAGDLADGQRGGCARHGVTPLDFESA